MPSRLIVLERTGRWAAGLRRAAGSRELHLVEVRSFAQTLRELAAQPATIVAIEASAATLSKVAAQLAIWRQRFSSARFLLLAEPQLIHLESALRDAGAVHVAYTTRDLASTVGLIRRHQERLPPPDLSLEESIWARLPWPAAVRG